MTAAGPPNRTRAGSGSRAAASVRVGITPAFGIGSAVSARGAGLGGWVSGGGGGADGGAMTAVTWPPRGTKAYARTCVQCAWSDPASNQGLPRFPLPPCLVALVVRGTDDMADAVAMEIAATHAPSAAALELAPMATRDASDVLVTTEGQEVQAYLHQQAMAAPSPVA